MGALNMGDALVKFSDPLRIMPRETQRKISDPLNLVSKPPDPPPPTQQQLYQSTQQDMATRRAAAQNQAQTTAASLSRTSIGAQTLGG